MKDTWLMSALKACETSCKELQESFDYLSSLSKGASDVERGIAFDAVVKRFEVTFEYAWKLMKVAAEYQGSEAFGPRPAIQEAIRYGWISDPDFWATALDARNASVHDYFGVGQEAYLDIVKEFIGKSDALLEKIRNI